MKKSSLYIVRIALLALVIQVVCPLFFTVVTDNGIQFTANKLSFHAEKHSVNAPILLKEKEENESEDRHLTIALVALIDFSEMASVLAQHHRSKIVPFLFFNRIDYQPPLFTLHRVFLI